MVWVSNMDANKLTELTNQLNLLVREITKHKKELENEFTYMEYEKELTELNFGIFGSRISLTDIEDVATRLKIADETYEDCYVDIDYTVETDGWDDTEQNVVTFKFFGDRRYTEEEIEKKKDELVEYITKLELKCKEIEKEIRELVISE